MTGGKCKVNWIRAARSKRGGGLGILRLGKFSRALRLRWLWKQCKKDIIKHDIMEAANAFHSLRSSNLQLINSANIILIPKKDGADTVGDFRPISLIHSFVKIITKALALRLQRFMPSIVSSCHSAFIKTRSIHDNFMAVRTMARRFHRNKTPALFSETGHHQSVRLGSMGIPP